MAAVSVVVGILAALAFPSMAGMQGRNDLRASMESVKSAVAEAQRNAIKMGASCTVTLTASTVTGTPAGCISSPVTLKTGQTLTWNSGLSSGIVFSYKGNTTQSGTLALSSTGTSDVKCLSIASGLGLFRTGNYTGSPTNPLGANCIKGL